VTVGNETSADFSGRTRSRRRVAGAGSLNSSTSSSGHRLERVLRERGGTSGRHPLRLRSRSGCCAAGCSAGWSERSHLDGTGRTALAARTRRTGWCASTPGSARVTPLTWYQMASGTSGRGSGSSGTWDDELPTPTMRCSRRSSTACEPASAVPACSTTPGPASNSCGQLSTPGVGWSQQAGTRR
jgi:hypothetical protein